MRDALPLVLASIAVLAAPAAARGDAPDESGVVLALRAGYGAPFGDLEEDAAAVGDVVSSKLPVWLELGYRFDRRFQGGLYFELAPARVSLERCVGGGCDAALLRAGIAVHVHLAPRARLDPWLGLGVGVEVLRADIEDPGSARVRRTWAGLEFPLAEAGMDVRVTPRFAFGPYLSVSVGRFTSRSDRPEGGTGARERIADPERHGWVQGGLRATVLLL